MTRVPSPISKLKKLASEKPGLADFLVYHDFLSASDDRATAIIEATQLEARIENLILTKMVALPPSDYKALFAPDAPIGTFAAKTKVAFALGLFGKNTRKDLDIIRYIRNAFAHAQKHIWFHTEEVADACNLITAAERTQNLHAWPGIPNPLVESRDVFLASTRLIGAAISRAQYPGLFDHESLRPPPLD